MKSLGGSKAHHPRGGLLALHVRAGATAALVALTTVAIADEPAANHKHEAKKTEDLEEIVVTATRREVPLQRLPEAITAITAERLDELNAQTFEDYFRDVPGLAVIQSGSDGKREYSLRGVSSGQISTSNNVDISTVSQYFDEIPVTANGFQMDPRLVDIERVEVLRGPQGTYYGEGALGGTIRTITRKPVLNQLLGSVEGRLASTQDGDLSDNANAMLNLPLWGTAALRLNGFYAKDGGYVDAVDLDQSQRIVRTHTQDINVARSSGFRGVLLVRPTDRFSIQAQAAHFQANAISDGYQPQVGDLLVGVSPCPTTPAPPPPPPGANPPSPGGAAPPPSGGGDMTSNCVGAEFGTIDRKANLYNVTLTGDLGWANLVSASSYARTNVNFGHRDEFTERPATRSDFLFQQMSGFTQELRLISSKDWSSRWDYVLGTYFQDKKTAYEYVGELAHQQNLEAKEAALFGDAGYMLAEQWQVRLGLRGSNISNHGAMDIPPDPANPQGRHIPTEATFHPVTGRTVLTYFINRDLMAYASIARGFRDGTLNDTSLNFSALASTPGFTPIPDHSNPDTNTTYELGWKLSFPEHKATLNGAVYRSDWKNMQVVSFAASSNPNGPNVIAGALPAYVNAPRARINGLELEAGLELLRGLQLRASMSLIDAVLTENFPLNLQNVGSALHARAGDRIPFVARQSGSVSLNYRRPVFRTFDGFATLNSQYQGQRTTDFNRTLNSTPADGGVSPVPFTTYFELRPYWTTGLQIGVQSVDWRAALYVDNVLNDRADLFHTLSRFTDRPRTIGLFIRHNFD
jgi:iron complex outermembrane recepter protein